MGDKTYQSKSPYREAIEEQERKAKTYRFKCRNPVCGKMFKTGNKHERYCCPDCRRSHIKSNGKRWR